MTDNNTFLADSPTELRPTPTNAVAVQCMYIWGFRTRQHLRSLALVMNEYG